MIQRELQDYLPLDQDADDHSGQRRVADFLLARWAPGETRRAYAHRIGIPEATLAELMVRRRTPSIKTLTALLNYFGDDLREFLGLPPEARPTGEAGNDPGEEPSVGKFAGHATFQAAVIRGLARKGLSLSSTPSPSGPSRSGGRNSPTAPTIVST
jgi:hypothetical protein